MMAFIVRGMNSMTVLCTVVLYSWEKEEGGGRGGRGGRGRGMEGEGERERERRGGE